MSNQPSGDVLGSIIGGLIATASAAVVSWAAFLIGWGKVNQRLDGHQEAILELKQDRKSALETHDAVIELKVENKHLREKIDASLAKQDEHGKALDQILAKVNVLAP